jgi:FkbM family methyltransferase
MQMVWRSLKYLPPPVLTFVKRHSSGNFRLWLRQKFGGDYSTIPDQIWTMPDGRKFHIGPDCAYWSLYMGLEHEPETSHVVRQLVRPGETVVDAGANYGWFTTLFAQAVSDSGMVYSFEPVPSTCERLIEHVKLNQMGERVTVVRAALNDDSGKATLHIFKNLSHTCASLSSLNEKEYQTVEAPMIRLDDYLRAQMVERVDFLKCDIEGSELAALRGSRHYLSSPEAPILLVEINEETSRAFGFGKDDLWRYLVEVGYDDFYEIESSYKLRRIARISDFKGQNLLCAKNGQVGRRLSKCDVVVQN